MKSFDQTFKVLPQRKMWNALKKLFFCTFNKHAPIKRKYVRVNEVSFITKELHKAIVERPR